MNSQYYISFSNIGGILRFESGNTLNDCKLIDFQNQAPSFQTIRVVSSNHKHADFFRFATDQLDLASFLYGVLAVVPTIEDGDGDIVLDASFMHFNSGDAVTEIWHWLEDSIGVELAKLEWTQHATQAHFITIDE